MPRANVTVSPARTVEREGDVVRCGEQEASLADGTIRLAAVGEDQAGQLDALWAVLQLVWENPEADAAVVEQLSLLP